LIQKHAPAINLQLPEPQGDVLWVLGAFPQSQAEILAMLLHPDSETREEPGSTQWSVVSTDLDDKRWRLQISVQPSGGVLCIEILSIGHA
jgi:hypothetical protein